MLDIPDQPILDKHSLIGGCLRLPMRIDATRLREEVEALPTEIWGTTGPRVGVHGAADALFLRGYLPAEGARPFDERPALALLPYIKEIMAQIGAPPLRCLLARLPAGRNHSAARRPRAVLREVHPHPCPRHHARARVHALRRAQLHHASR